MSSAAGTDNTHFGIGKVAASSVPPVTVALAVAFPSFSLLLYLPGTIYFSNLGEFTLRLNNLALIFLPIWLLAVTCGVAIIFLLPKKSRVRLVSLVFSLGFLLWLQGNLLVWQYGTFDGRGIEWDDHWQNGIIDSPIWVMMLLAGLIVPATVIKIGHVAAPIAMIVQFVLLLSAAAAEHGTTEEASARNFRIDYAPKYAFSSKQNVILFVLDAYQSDVFLEIIQAEPEYAGFFEGFTYFPDAVAGGNYTELAIPALLTGKMYDNSQPRDDFLRYAFIEHGITSRLKHAGYVVDIYPWVGWGNESIYFDEAVASNLKSIDKMAAPQLTFTEKNAKEALHLLDLSFFRASPHFVKRYVYNDQKWLVTHVATLFVPENVKQIVANDSQFEIGTFLSEMPEVSTDRGDLVFKYYHLKGAHSPLTVNANLEFTDKTFPFNRNSYVDQAKANLRGLSAVFEKLKRSGIYENSLILVLGDHGSGDSPEMYFEPDDAERTPLRLEGSLRNFRRDKARAIPLVLIKRIGSSSPLQISYAPVSLLDVPATIESELEADAEIDRPSMFELDPNVGRVRYHGAFEFAPNKGQYVDDITMYKIDGNSWLNESWTVGEIRPAARKERVE